MNSDSNRDGRESSTRQITFEDNQLVQQLVGEQNSHLKTIEKQLDVRVNLRGNQFSISGDAPHVEITEQLLKQLSTLIKKGYPLYAGDIVYAIRILSENIHGNLKDIFLDQVFIASNKRTITPKSVKQKEYIEAIRRYDITFGIGPAGTGKTYLAMAMAVAAMSKEQVRRIVLVRPAVEAGEKLGFLPGDLAEKVNPYLRPLYDALHDMMDFERASKLIERGSIEVAPLAFMRGRAQPLTSKILTVDGWREMGSLKVGDYVIGSDGQPTRVSGVYPQGEKNVYRVTMTDGASTLCCAEHLWSVYTASDKRRHKPARIVETREMLGNLRSAHQHRYELPLLSRPVHCPDRDVPLDAYALGLLLGDGCLTTSTTPSFSSGDPELVQALAEALQPQAVAAVHKSGPDYILRNTRAGRGGLRIPNPVTVILRDLKLAGTCSATKFIPEVYLNNSEETRLAVLQGLLDSDGNGCVQQGRTCRIQYATTSERLKEDVIHLVRSLGGIAYQRVRKAEGRKPGHAGGRDIFHRADAFVLEIRLPEAMSPFRLTRKAEQYAKYGAGRPMRFIKSIEPEGEAETQCIRVAAQDHLYVTDDFIVTHNTLNDAFVILDEAQNTTSEQMKMFLTRLGLGSKAVITGDITQIDLPEHKVSGLVDAMQLLKGIQDIRFVFFTKQDVVRHRLVQEIIHAYEQAEKRTTESIRIPQGNEHG